MAIPTKGPEETEQQVENLVPLPASVEVVVADDQMTAYAVLRPPVNGGAMVTAQDIGAALLAKRVNAGVQQEVIDKLVREPEYNRMVPVALGVLAQEGRNASLDYQVALALEHKPREREDGTVDYHDLGLINNVKAGQVLCVMNPAVKGTPGHTVLGKPLMPPTVKNVLLPMGKNTRILENQLTLVAAIAGHLDFSNGKINVLNVFTVNGPVCNATGNVDFDGSVIVTGDVMAGFRVRATGRIEVAGYVDNATLESGGDIKIQGGIKGHGREPIRCGGSLKALFIENAELLVTGDVSADVIMQSTIRCGGTLKAEGKRGAILGGLYVVAQSVHANVVGTPSSLSTTFELGIDPMRNDRLKAVENRLRVLEKECQKLTQIVGMLQPLRDTGRISPERDTMLEKAIVTHASMLGETQALRQEQASLRQEMQSYTTSALVCRRELYMGVKLTIGTTPYVVGQDLLRSRLHLSPEREILITPI